ncbi:serine hydrolase [Zeaxanthinibacter enoshimensis]|uniref:serine hydrolase n=1 Tax=Zeaxanthinibacter enoshimensis TaxID=392009 RepID=UPI003563D965
MRTNFLFITTFFILTSLGLFLYPIDGYNRSGITRLLQIRKFQEDSIPYTRIPKGAYLGVEDIRLNLLSRRDDPMEVLLTEDRSFAERINKLFPGKGYSATVMDITNPDSLRYAAFREEIGYQPGSVGKLAVLIALFDQLAKLCPDDFEQRVALMRNRRVKSGIWGTGDHHTVPIYNPQTNQLTRRTVRAEDEFSLFEWADHMVSVSNNGAASVVYREALLMAALGEDYLTLTPEQAEKFFKETPRDSLTNLSHRIVNEPLREMGITEDEWRLGGFFTNGPDKYVSRKGGSIGTPVGLMKFMLKMEQGLAIDAPSSLEMKRILYLTDRRIRYAHSPRLNDAAVYFKSGSFYKCDRKKNPDCGEYAGNVFNYMNSVILVEHPDGTRYIVCLMTNVLNKNSAGEHMYLATAIDRILH